jgi:sulfofructosephosphate aldolase
VPDREDLAALARPSGAFAMVALDQRESLRTMLTAVNGESATDDDLTTFKVEAARPLTPHASAVLLDRDYGLWPVLEADAVADGCRLIVAADRLLQEPGAPVEWTELDEAVLGDPPTVEVADAFKLLVIWRPDREREERRRLVMAFLEGCRTAGKPGIVEAIVRLDRGRANPAEHVRHVVAPASSSARSARTSTRRRSRHSVPARMT